MPNTRRGYLDALCVVFIWSGFVLISRIGGKSALLSYDVVALRFGVASLCLMPYWILRNKVNILTPKMITLGLIGGIGYCLFVYFAFRNAPAAHAGILLPGLMPFEATIFSWLLLGEKPSRVRLIGLGVIALGVVSLAVENMHNGFTTVVGDASFVAAGCLWALYAILVRKWGVAPWDATIACAVVSAMLYLPVYFLFLPKAMSLAPWGTIALQAFYQGFLAMVVGMIFYMRAMKALGPTRVGLCMALIPALAGVAAVPLLGEPLSALVVLGLALTLTGAWVGSKG